MVGLLILSKNFEKYKNGVNKNSLKNFSVNIGGQNFDLVNGRV